VRGTLGPEQQKEPRYMYLGSKGRLLYIPSVEHVVC